MVMYKLMDINCNFMLENDLKKLAPIKKKKIPEESLSPSK